MEKHIQIYNLLLEQDYLVKKINITIFREKLTIDIHMEIDILENFIRSFQFENIKPNKSNSLTLEINTNEFKKFPDKIKEINYYIYSEPDINILNMFPNNLKILHIQSELYIDLLHLPINLDTLYLFLDKKINLCSLPENLKTLHLRTRQLYQFEELMNLPIGLKYIWIGYIFYNSFNELSLRYENDYHTISGFLTY